VCDLAVVGPPENGVGEVDSDLGCRLTGRRTFVGFQGLMVAFGFTDIGETERGKGFSV
jgi:hypothetical protein